jgi:hypothetical protein
MHVSWYLGSRIKLSGDNTTVRAKSHHDGIGDMHTSIRASSSFSEKEKMTSMIQDDDVVGLYGKHARGDQLWPEKEH